MLSSALPYLTNPYIALAAAALAILLACWCAYLTVRLNRLTKGGDGKSIEGALAALRADVTELSKFREEMEQYIISAERRLRRSIQFADLERFNPFQGTGDGGSQSFTSALLSEEGDGMVLSTIHARERMHVYGKRVEGFASANELTDEEQGLLTKGKEKLTKERYGKDTEQKQ